MTETTDRAAGGRFRLSDGIATASLLLVVAGGIWNSSSTSTAVQKQGEDLTRRVERLEASDAKKTDQVTEILDRTARLETKIDILLGRKDPAK